MSKVVSRLVKSILALFFSFTLVGRRESGYERKCVYAPFFFFNYKIGLRKNMSGFNKIKVGNILFIIIEF